MSSTPPSPKEKVIDPQALIKLCVVKSILREKQDKVKRRAAAKEIHHKALGQAVKHWTNNELQGSFGAFRKLLGISPTSGSSRIPSSGSPERKHHGEEEGGGLYGDEYGGGDAGSLQEGSWEILDHWDDRLVSQDICFDFFFFNPRESV